MLTTSGQSDNSRPEQLPRAQVQVIFPYEIELAVASHPKYGQAARDSLHPACIANGLLHRIGRNEYSATGIDGKRARVNPLGVNILDQRRFARFLIDREHGDIIFSACENGLALEVRGDTGTIGDVHELAVRMDVNCPQNLP